MLLASLAVLFAMGAVALVPRVPTPSGAQIHERYDRTERADPARTAAAKLPPGFTKVSAEPLPGVPYDYGRPVQPLDLQSDFAAAAENGKASNGHA